ncbi:DUF262 domain-containing protein [Paeniglutamicibacter sp. NPDC091659]|uniref:DUF262 domain-containing protein n=1 Tax=Paeniglutamicibacter sp. NPDC091659 TaxID=3364389 RepID=UPI003811BF5B
MAISKQDVAAVSIGDLLDEPLRVPNYQRPYAWTPDIARQLLFDIQDAQQSSQLTAEHKTPPYVLGAVILHKEERQFNIVDGQQRLLTLRMLLRILEEQQLIESFDGNSTPISEVWRHLREAVKPLTPEKRQALASFIRDSCQVVRVVTNDVDEAFRVFDSQNYRGKPLAPHDLLKAHHLREMRGESDASKSAIVEEWEFAGDKALNELFSSYLYRIRKWSLGESAPEFTSHNISMFKGLSGSASLPPAAKYHLAAQSVIPILNSWQHTLSDKDERDAKHSRFQLDVPIASGRPFFEMVAFMVHELQRLKNRPFPIQSLYKSENDPLTFGNVLEKSRYRKVTELHLAAMLYYINRFSEDDLEVADQRLFAWAFDIRVSRLRVVRESINNAGYGKGDVASPFPVFHNSLDWRVVQRFGATGNQHSETHELELFALLNGITI